MPVRPALIPVSRGGILLLPQPERICLLFRIDTLGVHQIGLYKLDEALSILTTWLPHGPRAEPDPAADADSVLFSSERSALVTVTHYTTQGSAEIAGARTDLILAHHHGRLHLFSRDPNDTDKLVPSRARTETCRHDARRPADVTSRRGSGT